MHKTLLIIGSEKVNQSRSLTIKQGCQKDLKQKKKVDGTEGH